MVEEHDPRSEIARIYLALILVAGLLLLGMTGVLGSDMPPTRTSTLNVGKGYDFSTIGSALAAASENDIIVVHPGTYLETLTLEKKVELHGTNMNTTLVDGGGYTPLTIIADGCKVSGLNLTGGIPMGWSGEEVWTAGLELRSDRNEIYGCYMQNNYFGLLMRDSDDNWIRDSISAENRKNGVLLSGASQNRFDNLHCFQNDDSGFSFFFSPDNDLYYCRSESNGGSGWEIVDSEREYIRFSTANGNGRKGYEITGSFDTNVIENCKVIGNIEDGIWISTDEYPNIENCTIAENGKTGVKLINDGYETKARIFNNLIMNNSAWAVEIDPGSGWCLITRNDIVNNGHGRTPQIFDSGDRTFFNSGMTGNYWNDWLTPDTDMDGIVDVHYDISGAASTTDEFPSTRRFTNHSYESVRNDDPYHPTIIQEIPGDAIVDEMYTIYFNAVDKDTPPSGLTWGLETSVDWLTMEGNILKGRPSINDIGSYTVRIWVSDGISTDEFVFDLDVLINPYHAENLYPPSIISGHIQDANIGIQYIRSYTAADPDTNIEDLDWSVTTTAGFLSMEGNVLRGAPSAADIGAFTVSILVTDGEFTDISSFTLTVHPPDSDDDVPDPDLIDIEEYTKKETGEIVLSAKDLTEGKVNFIEFEWYINGVLSGSESSLVVDLAHGIYTIILRARAPDNDWYEVSKEGNVNGVGDSRQDADIIALIIGIFLLIIIVLISSFLIYTRKRRTKARGVRQGSEWTDNMDPEIHFKRSFEDPVKWGPIEDRRRFKHTLEREGSAVKRGPHIAGPQSSLEEEYDIISREALTWKRPSRFTMKRKKMRTKLRMKLVEGEIDNDLHDELADFIDDHFPEGKD